MESDWAREHLQTIRTLMERMAVYRRTLAPMTLTAGIFGVIAGALGWVLPVSGARAFVGYWLAVALLASVTALLIVRRQALRAHEPFWSPPTRRVGQAAALPLFAGFAVGLGAWWHLSDGTGSAAAGGLAVPFWLPCLWIVLYGCAVHAAGFFMPRGIRLFGGILVVLGCLLYAFIRPDAPDPRLSHTVMAGCFGGLHLAYGLYLRFTEPRESAA
ncbi:MAG: hypothetical protein H7A45_07340 [Verrucomicrobiales bacterium]|nr:hypothetical protein [Verrucomicrobiales bacterium]MCP5528271.1 hypothetical protein [Verrucomicrobiales bacterium]